MSLRITEDPVSLKAYIGTNEDKFSLPRSAHQFQRYNDTLYYGPYQIVYGVRHGPMLVDNEGYVIKRIPRRFLPSEHQIRALPYGPIPKMGVNYYPHTRARKGIRREALFMNQFPEHLPELGNIVHRPQNYPLYTLNQLRYVRPRRRARTILPPLPPQPIIPIPRMAEPEIQRPVRQEIPVPGFRLLPEEPEIRRQPPRRGARAMIDAMTQQEFKRYLKNYRYDPNRTAEIDAAVTARTLRAGREIGERIRAAIPKKTRK